ncbi:MAG: hypothetical protein ACFFC3_10220 [Candidatus Odinarchaeota archaeon]
MEQEVYESYVGGYKWRSSDKIYYKLTGRKINSKYFPIIPISVSYLPDLIPNKKLLGLFWSTPTFKDTDCQYLFHVYDEYDVDFVISTSSGNTVESMANVIKRYNQESNKKIKAILLVPEISSYKVSKNAIENNPYVYYIVLKNSTLDSIREFANKLKEKLLERFNVILADANLKTAAYSQVGFVLDQMNLLNDEVCFVQTVSGGVCPAGVIEYASFYNINPEFLVIQPFDSKTTPIIDALHEHSLGHDPFEIFKKWNYETPNIETTLGSTKPLYAIENFIKWREHGGTVLGAKISKEELYNQKTLILKTLVDAGVYTTNDQALKFFELEKSGIMAFIGAIKSAKEIRSNNIIVNFTGRYPEKPSTLPSSATPHVLYNPDHGIEQLIKILNI